MKQIKEEIQSLHMHSSQDQMQYFNLSQIKCQHKEKKKDISLQTLPTKQANVTWGIHEYSHMTGTDSIGLMQEQDAKCQLVFSPAYLLAFGLLGSNCKVWDLNPTLEVQDLQGIGLVNYNSQILQYGSPKALKRVSTGQAIPQRKELSLPNFSLNLTYNIRCIIAWIIQQKKPLVQYLSSVQDRSFCR